MKLKQWNKVVDAMRALVKACKGQCTKDCPMKHTGAGSCVADRWKIPKKKREKK